AAASSKSVVLFNMPSGRRLRRALTTRQNVVYAVAFSGDDKTLAEGGSAGEIAFYDLASDAQSRRPLTGMRIVNSLAFGRNDKTSAAGGAGAMVLWNLAKPGSPPDRLLAHHGGVNSVAFSPDGKMLASGGTDHTITLWTYPVRTPGVPLANLAHASAHVAVS